MHQSSSINAHTKLIAFSSHTPKNETMQLLISIHLALLLGSASAAPRPKASTPSWRQLPDCLTGPIQENSVTSLNGRVYSVGGVHAIANATEDPTTNIVQSYSISSNRWNKEEPLPMPLNHANVATVGQKIYVLGGLATGSGQWPNWVAIGNSWVYDPMSKVWSALPPSPAGTHRGSSAVGVYKDTIYLAGGLGTLAASSYKSVNTVTAYNTRRKQWSTLPSLPTVLDHSGGALVGNILYVIGGRVNGSEHGAGNVGTVYALDVTSRKLCWVEKAPMPTARSGFATAVVGEKIYTFGGEGDRSRPDTYVFADVEVFDTVNGTWKVLPKWSIPR